MVGERKKKVCIKYLLWGVGYCVVLRLGYLSTGLLFYTSTKTIVNT